MADSEDNNAIAQVSFEWSLLAQDKLASLKFRRIFITHSSNKLSLYKWISLIPSLLL